MPWIAAADNLITTLSFWYQGLHDTDHPLSLLGDLADELFNDFRTLGILLLLGNNDSDLFLHNLMRSAQMRLSYLERMQVEGIEDDFYQASGHYEPILAAIAAEDYDTVQGLYRLSAKELRPGEYEDDRCHAQILFRLAASCPPPAADYQPFIDEYLEILDGEVCVRLDLVRAFIAREQQSFDVALASLLNEFGDNEVSEDDLPGVRANHAICIEALAMLRLASKHGLTTAAEYPYCPTLARATLRNPLPELPK